MSEIGLKSISMSTDGVKFTPVCSTKDIELAMEENPEWKEKNKDRLREMINKSRNKRAEKLKAEGCINPWSVISKGAIPKYKDKTLTDDILDLMGSDKE